MPIFTPSSNKPVLPLGSPLKPETDGRAKTPDYPAAPGPTNSDASEDFVLMIEKELGTFSPLGLTAEVFADRINATTALRYYFQEPTEKELAALGFYRQGYWLRVLPDSKNNLISVPKVASVLRAACIRAHGTCK